MSHNEDPAQPKTTSQTFSHDPDLNKIQCRRVANRIQLQGKKGANIKELVYSLFFFLSGMMVDRKLLRYLDPGEI